MTAQTATPRTENPLVYTFVSTFDGSVQYTRQHKNGKMYSVTGTVNDAKMCAGPCVNARGGDCECSCGGRNHGMYA